VLPKPAPDPLGPPEATHTLPGSVRVALGMAQVLAGYAAVMAVMLIPVGLFVGPHLLWAALGHALLAGTLVAGARGLERRKGWGRWLVAGVAALVMVGLPAALAIEGGADRPARAWFGGVAAYGAVLLGAAASPGVARWCRGG